MKGLLPYKVFISVFLLFLIYSTSLVIAQTSIGYTYNGGSQTFQVPPCVSSVTISAWGAGGGGGGYDVYNGGSGGGGAFVQRVISVAAGDVFTIRAGEGGKGGQCCHSEALGGAGGWGNNNYNGGQGGQAGSHGYSGGGGGGGGATAVLFNSSLIIVAGGGGGAGGGGASGNGSTGGGGGQNGFSYTTCFSSGIAGASSNGCGTQGGNMTYPFGDDGGGGGGGGGGSSGGTGGGVSHDYDFGGCGGGGGTSWPNGINGNGQIPGNSTYPGFSTNYAFGGAASSGGSGFDGKNGYVLITYNVVQPTASFTNTTVCLGNNTDFSNLSSCINGTILSYYWNFGDGTTSTALNPSHQFSAPGTYNVTLTINTTGPCSDDITQEVVVYPLPVITTTQFNSLCWHSNDGWVHAAVTGGTPGYTYQWNTSANNTSDSLLNLFSSAVFGGPYILIVSDAHYCTKTASVTITEPPLLTGTPSQTNVSCFNGSNGTAGVIAGGGTPPYFYYWNTIPTSTNPSVENLPAGNLSITVTDSHNCDTINDLIITEPLPVLITGDTSYIICSGESVQFSSSATGGTPPYSYYVNTFEQNIPYTVQPLVSSNYNISATDSRGCTSGKIFISVEVNSHPTAEAGENQRICVGEGVILEATGGENYLWNNNISQGLVFYPQETEIYTVTVTNSNGCSSTDSVWVFVDELPVVNAGFDTIILVGEQAQLQAVGGQQYLWYPAEGLSSTTIANPIASPKETIEYIVESINNNGCKNSDTVIVYVEDKDIVFVPNGFSPNNDGRNDVLKVQGFGIKDVRLTIYDRWGVRVFETESLDDGWDGTYQGKQLNTAVFVYNLWIHFYRNERQYYEKGNITLVR
ncbi:MAG TPA: hypothetical protein DEH02_19930 [Bacteroidales bacterium]|nr:MAG: hypothetical protein A2X01_18665 [Bacteroidetes bacterium GWF2_35_48]HBX53334.1 hypothetical protein [Bacteroidales bacterium]